MAFPQTGHLFYKDEYDTLYEVTWETIEHEGIQLYDFTTAIKQPHVWGQADSGYIKNRVVYRRGICTVIRQVLAPTIDGYAIVAEGTSQLICTFPTTFSGDETPSDPFVIHLDSMVSEEVEHRVMCGPRFNDPEEPAGSGGTVGGSPIVWVDVDAGGNIIPYPGKQTFQWVDVWGNDESIPAFACP